MLTSLQSSLIKQIRSLHRAKGRRDAGLFLIEGTHLIEAACSVDRAIVAACCTEAWQEQHPLLWEQVIRRAQRVEVVSVEVLRAIATTTEPDGIVATLERTSTRAPEFTHLGLVLQTIQDPGNLGTMIRTVAAAGAEGLLLSSDSVDLDHPKVVRASAGAWFQVPMSTRADLLNEVCGYQQQGFQVVATLPTAKDSFWDIDLQKPTLVLLGNEGAGLSPELIAIADHAIRIPINPGVESLNVAVAAALILYEAKRQRQKKL